MYTLHIVAMCLWSLPLVVQEELLLRLQPSELYGADWLETTLECSSVLFDVFLLEYPRMSHALYRHTAQTAT